jgi:hypothetical protein
MAPAGLSAASTCVVGATDFSTETTLCDPQLSDDTLGWFGQTVGTTLGTLCKNSYSEVANNAIQTGMQSNVLASGCDQTYAAMNSAASATTGYGAIVGNARVVSSYFMDTKSGNLFVNAGTSQSSAFLTYTVSGLAPNASVTFTCDAYSLYSPTELEVALDDMNIGSSKKALVTSINLGHNLTFGMQSSGSKLTPGSGQINGNKASIYVCTGGILNNQAQGDKQAASLDWGTKTKMTLTTTADANGRVTFTFGRAGGAEYAPVGIDNIEVTSSIQPTIVSQKRLPVCAGNPVQLYLTQTFPAGTTYSWSGVGTTTSTTSTYNVVPEDANKTYTASCKVTMGACVATSTFDLTSKACCTQTVNGKIVPLAETSIFFDDFGTFPDNSTYQYTDQLGTTHTMPVAGGLWTDVKRPYVTFLQPGVSTPDITACTGNPSTGYAITNVDPYNPGVTGDASGTGRGGMFIFDLSGSGNAGKVVYERTVTGLCQGKEISFSAMFGAINNNTSPNVGSLNLVLRSGSSSGAVIYETGKTTLNGTEGWQEASKSFTLAAGISTVVLQVVNVDDNYGNSQGDFAIDNISFTVCTPPDVSVDATLTGSAKNFLDLCKNDILTLQAQISQSAKDYYGTPYYIFQYSYDDPTAVAASKVKWYDLNTPSQSSDSYEIKDPADHVAFKQIKDGTVAKVYFRVVIGDQTYLDGSRSEWDTMSALNACRAVSFSSIPITAGLNCAQCYTPKAVSITDVSAKTNKATKALTLCAGDETSLSAVVTPATDNNGKSYDGYYLFWRKDDADIAGYTKLQDFAKDAGGNAVTNPSKALVVKNDGSYTKETKVKYKVIAVDTFEFKSVKAATCKDSFDVDVTFLANPKAVAGTAEFCEGLPTTATALPTSTEGTVNLMDDTHAPLTTIDFKTLKSGVHTYYYNVTAASGCQSDTVDFVVTVDTIPTLKVPDVAPFCAGLTTRVLPSDTLSKAYTIDWGGKEQDLSKLTGSATPYTYIYKVTDVKSSCVSVPETLSITAKPAVKIKELSAKQECGKTTVTVDVDPKDATRTWSFAKSAISETLVFDETMSPNSGVLELVATDAGYCDDSKSVQIDVLSVPKKPTTADVSYLKSQASSFKDVMLTSGDKAAVMNDASTADLEFEWSSDNGATWSTIAPTPTVKDASSPKEEDVTYRVRVTNKTTGCHSDTATVVARIYGAPVPNVSDTAYCVGTTAGALSSNVRINQALAGETYTLKYYDSDKTTELTAGEIPSTAAAGVHTYYATQSSATGGESDKVGFKVTVYGVDTAQVAKESYLYCKNDVANALTATVNKAEASYKMSDGLQWSSDGGTTWSATAPTPSTATVGSATYNVKQTYTITASKEVCEGKAVNITVTTSETTDPTGTMSVSYVLADADGNGGKFKDLLGQSATTVDVEAGYTYQYAECDASGAVSGAWSTTVPTPSVPSKSDLNGGSKTIYYAVKRIATAAPNCESGTKVITVTISDSPMPDVTPGYYCEGETIADLGSSVKVNTQKKAADKYELLWYGTTKPASSADYAAGSTTVPATPAATVADSKTPNVMTYYVAQKDKETDAIGTASALVITVYPKPVQTITDPAAVCETAVDLGKSLKYDAVVKTATYNTSYYSDAAGTTALTGSTVTASGAYYAQTAFAVPSATNSGAVCASTVDKITVTVDTLTLQKVIDAQTCPNTAAILTATAGSNAKSVVFDWSGESNSDTKSDAQTPASGSATSKFTTVALAGKAGDTYKYDLKVTAGTCTESQKGIVITIGDGPVEGTLTLEETDNKETGKVYTDTRDNTADPFYTCGNGITATASFTKDATSDYTWSDANGKSVGTGATAKLPGAGIYTITYNNQCATSVKFEVKDASIKDNKLTVTSKVTPSATGKELELCEGEAFSMDLSYTCAEAGTISWTHDGTAATGISGKSVSLPKATPAESGTYAYTITNHGCTATGDTTIKVKPYIQFAPEQYAYVARRDSQLTIKTNITVPASGTPSDISWTENGTSAGTGKDKDLTVTSDHSYLVKMSDADYCPDRDDRDGDHGRPSETERKGGREDVPRRQGRLSDDRHHGHGQVRLSVQSEDNGDRDHRQRQPHPERLEQGRRHPQAGGEPVGRRHLQSGLHL